MGTTTDDDDATDDGRSAVVGRTTIIQEKNSKINYDFYMSSTLTMREWCSTALRLVHS